MRTTPGSELRQKYLPCESVRFDGSLENYINMLKSKGLIVHPSLFCSFFKLRNNLEYCGVATKDIIKPNEILVKVPQELILSASQALKQVSLDQIYQDKYYKDCENWQYRVLITYLLYLLQGKNQQNVWYHMVLNMSKDIDILCFWEDQQLELLKDKVLKQAALKQRKYFQNEWIQFQKCRLNYQFLRKQSFKKQNFRWIYIHIVSRCFDFGEDLLCMVPFGQLFNHHISDVYYTNQKNQIQQQLLSIQSYDDKYQTSSQSDQSCQYTNYQQFDYDILSLERLNWSCKQCLNLVHKQKKDILQKIQNIQISIRQTNCENYTILFIGHVIQKYKIVLNEYLVGRVNYNKTLKQLIKISENIQEYRQQVIKINFILKKNKQNIKNQQILPNNEQIFFTRPQPRKKSFNNFILKTGQRDIFNPNNQIYFCYGRRSNRVTLLHYGIAIQGNKYDHLWIWLDIANNIENFPDVVDKTIKQNLSVKRKFKLKYSDFNIEIIIFLRLKRWKYYLNTVKELFHITNIDNEIINLIQMKQIYEKQLTFLTGNNNLTETNISYHEYFIRVYIGQKIKILKKHINIINKIIILLKQSIVFQKINGKVKWQNLNSIQQYMIRNYINFFI